MNTFLVGAASMAAVVGTVVAVYKVLQARTRVVVDAIPHKFEIPLATVELHEALQEFSNQAELTLPARVQALAGYPGALFVGRLPVTTLWEIRIRNGGHEVVDGLEIQIPYAVVSTVRYSDGTESNIDGTVLQISRLRPEERVSILSWSRHLMSEKPRVLQSKGRARVRLHGTVGPGLMALALWLKYPSQAVASLVAVLVTLVAVIIGIIEMLRTTP